ncbi:(2Fe-2S)-binding protein [Streptomyces morookaense]|uniref:(2Fe-2S)-binding protein n=1 Tax=Streptomyces morookaense TaxID=1970 RepID=A0A7Y7BAS0_STRMO|nr:(2Fe-2S)-binding protein [Streptomyces morookaense]NVK82162.1 (2Fe-2S)-binding protein [Streptomyces morookaense]GHF45760.1 hypothetical protein GCM10010359_55500 [Streptomyces morookaense]
MSDEQQRHTEGGWQPIPQGAGLEADGTTFVQLPPELLAQPGTSGGWGPLAAPGTPAPAPAPAPTVTWPDPYAAPAATGEWDVRANGTGNPADPQATQEWTMSFTTEGDTGQWSVPAAGDDSVEESGEYPVRDRAAAPGDITGTGDHRAETWTAAPAPEPEPAPEPAAVPVEPADEQRTEDEAGAPEPAPEPAPAPAPEAAQGPAPGASGETEAVAEPEPEAEPEAEPHDEHPRVSYVLNVNGIDRPVTDSWIGESLLYVLRERLGLAGAKDGCSQGECGACSVQVDGRLVVSCLVPAATTAGSDVRTVEGLTVDGQPSDVQRALVECGAVQCGFCVPGLAMTVHDLLEGNHAPTELETRQAICGNLCRCSGYRGVLEAVRQVADERAETAAAHDEAQQPETETARIPHQAGLHNGGSGRATA